MQELYPRLAERNRRLSVGSEDSKLGPGGIGHMAVFSVVLALRFYVESKN